MAGLVLAGLVPGQAGWRFAITASLKYRLAYARMLFRRCSSWGQKEYKSDYDMLLGYAYDATGTHLYETDQEYVTRKEFRELAVNEEPGRHGRAVRRRTAARAKDEEEAWGGIHTHTGRPL